MDEGWEYWVDWINYEIEKAEGKKWLETNEVYVMFKNDIEIVLEDL